MKTIQLYRKNAKGDVALLEVNPNSFADRSDFEEALDFYYGEGYCDSYAEAKAS